MKRVAAIAVCGLALSACSSMPSWMSFDLPQPAPPTIAVQVESVPPGAEARASTGAACRTPCALAVAGEQATVTFTLPGYQPQSIPVRLVSSNQPPDPNNHTTPPPRMEPNPVYAELLPVPPPVMVKKKTRKVAPRPKKVTTVTSKPAPAAPPHPAPAPAPAAAWPPPPPAPAR